MTDYLARYRRTRRPGYVPGIQPPAHVAPFVPTDIAGCKLWLRADSLSLNDDDPVALWEDESGEDNDASQGVAEKKPTFKTGIINGKPVVRNALGDSMLLTGMTVASGSKTLFAVIDPPTVGTSVYLLDTETGRLIFAALTGTANKIGWFDGAWKLDAAAAASFQLLCWHLTSGGNGEMFRDTVSLGTAAYTAKAIGDAVALFNDFGEGGTSLVGDLAEIILYDTALSEANRAKVEVYLNNKYAIY